MCVMGVYWCTEAIPIALTAMLPIFLLPMLGILTAKQACAKYIKVSYELHQIHTINSEETRKQ